MRTLIILTNVLITTPLVAISQDTSALFQSYLHGEIIAGKQRISLNSHDVDAYARTANAFSMLGYSLSSLEILNEGVLSNPKAVKLWMLIA